MLKIEMGVCSLGEVGRREGLNNTVRAMLEAVNSVLQTAPLVRGNVEQVSTSDSYAANPSRVQKVAQAPYVSPYIVVDIDHNKAILQIRDSETGDVVRSFPTDQSLELRARDEERQANVIAGANAQNVASEVSASTSGQANGLMAAAQRDANAGPAATARQMAAFASASQSSFASAGNGASVTMTA